MTAPTDAELLDRAHLIVDNFADVLPDTLLGEPVTVDLIADYLRIAHEWRATREN